MKTCSYCGTEYPDDAVVCATDNYPLTSKGAEVEQVRSAERHSGLGIASFGVSVAVGCLMLAAFIVAGVLSAGHAPRGQGTYLGQVVVGLSIMFLLAVDVVAVALGIAGLCQPGKNRLFALLGVVFSSATILGTAGLIILGLYFGPSFRG